MRKYIVTAAVLAAFMMITGAAFADVYGTVTDEDGLPVEHALVMFVREGEHGAIFNDFTGADGSYSVAVSPVSVDQEAQPQPFSLGQSFPNPFNPSTTIPFSLDSSQAVSLAIFNIAGQRVRTLADSWFDAGQHSAVWDGRDDSGRSLAAGIYIYRIKSGGRSASGKMLMIDGGAAGAVSSGVSGTAAAKSALDVLSLTVEGVDVVYFSDTVTLPDASTELNMTLERREGAIKNLTPHESSDLITEYAGAEGFTILDVRTAAEFADIRIKDAINIDMKSETFVEDVAALDKDKVYLVHCLGGFRSLKASLTLEELGFTNLYNMLDGIYGWIGAGLPVETK